MKELFFLALFVVSLAVPVTATELNEDTLNEPVSFGDTSVLVDPSDPAVTQDPVSDPAPIAEDEASDSAALASSDLSGGYYFVCDCDLGYDLKFYVPLEWASDVFALSGTGSPVNMSTSTCYAFCPDYPDYTFQCNRFSEFTYRANNYNSANLNISKIGDTNITFLENEGKRLLILIS